MHILATAFYKCDICGKIEPWTKGQWYAYEFAFDMRSEMELHVCSSECEKKLLLMTSKQRKDIYRETFSNREAINHIKV